MYIAKECFIDTIVSAKTDNLIYMARKMETIYSIPSLRNQNLNTNIT